MFFLGFVLMSNHRNLDQIMNTQENGPCRMFNATKAGFLIILRVIK